MNHDDWRHLFLSVVESIDRLTEQVEKSMEELDSRLFNIEDQLGGITRALRGKNNGL